MPLMFPTNVFPVCPPVAAYAKVKDEYISCFILARDEATVPGDWIVCTPSDAPQFDQQDLYLDMSNAGARAQVVWFIEHARATLWGQTVEASAEVTALYWATYGHAQEPHGPMSAEEIAALIKLGLRLARRSNLARRLDGAAVRFGCSVSSDDDVHWPRRTANWREQPCSWVRIGGGDCTPGHDTAFVEFDPPMPRGEVVDVVEALGHRFYDSNNMELNETLWGIVKR